MFTCCLWVGFLCWCIKQRSPVKNASCWTKWHCIFFHFWMCNSIHSFQHISAQKWFLLGWILDLLILLLFFISFFFFFCLQNNSLHHYSPESSSSRIVFSSEHDLSAYCDSKEWNQMFRSRWGQWNRGHICATLTADISWFSLNSQWLTRRKEERSSLFVSRLPSGNTWKIEYL